MTQQNPGAVLGRMIMGQILSSAVGLAARLGVADLLASGPRTAEDLARDCSAHAPSLRRLLRALAAYEVFEELPDGRFGLTPLSEVLRDDAPGSMRAIAALFGGGPHARGWAEAIHSARTGETVAERVFGAGLFEVLAKEPEEQAIFNRAMTQNTAILAEQIVGAYDFSRFSTIVDVGGGEGLLLARVLATAPGARGILYDLAHVVEGARAVLEGAGVAERCEVVGGDFFSSVPRGGDLYMMKAIIHDWDDERSSTILANCRARMGDGSTLAVIDRVMPERITPDDETRRAVLMDLNMLVMAGGRERTEAEFVELFGRAGFALTGVTPTPSGVGILEGAPA